MLFVWLPLVPLQDEKTAVYRVDHRISVACDPPPEGVLLLRGKNLLVENVSRIGPDNDKLIGT